MSTSANLFLSSEIAGHEVTDEYLYLTSADGGRYTIPLSMLGYFRDPYGPDAQAELIFLRTRPRVQDVEVSDRALIVTFADGRVLSAPLHWFPRLLHGTAAELQSVEIWGETGLHWAALDEDIDAAGLFKMMGPSAESEASIQRWLAKRSEQQPLRRIEAEEKQVAEDRESYSSVE